MRVSRARGGDATGSVTDGGSTQQLVRATMVRVGGYWRPLAAVARLLEELGELAELLLGSPQEREELASELADLWIITTAVADQFLGNVMEPGSHALGACDIHDRGGGAADAPEDQLAPLVIAAAQIARIVNYYDGPKTPRSVEGWPSLTDAVAEFHRGLADFASAHDVELGTAVSDKLRVIPSRDGGRFAVAEHDPSTAACLEQFRQLETTIAGPDIGEARLWGAPAWPAQAPAASVAAIVPTLRSFTRAASRERLDGYVIAGPAVESSELAGDWAQAVLGELASRDGHAEGEPSVEGKRFTFNDASLSACVFRAPRPYILLRLSDVEGEHRAR